MDQARRIDAQIAHSRSRFELRRIQIAAAVHAKSLSIVVRPTLIDNESPRVNVLLTVTAAVPSLSISVPLPLYKRRW
jgi:hypothetical protein